MPEDDQYRSTSISESSYSDARVQTKIQDFVDNETFRKRIIAIVDEYSDNKLFIKKIKEYAGEEYDNRILKSARFWTTTILVTIVTSAISAVLAFAIARAT